MDNLTHSLFGLTFAEAALSFRRDPEPPTPFYRSAMYLASVAANNLPDGDVLYTWITGGRLGYLLHHRGHTHTLLGGVPLALLLILVCWGTSRLLKVRFRRSEWIGLCVIISLGLVTHIVLDSLNSYGVHPFWPWDSTWKYGDAVFILEPAFWIGLLPLPIIALQTRRYRILYLILFLMAVATVWFSGFVPKSIAFALTVFGFGLLVLLSRLTPDRRALLTCGVAVLVIGIFDVGSRVTRARFIEHHELAFRQSSLKDVILSPFPANPLCWNVVTMEVENEKVISRRARFAPHPEWITAEDCPLFRLGSGSAGYRPVRALNTSRVVWYDQAETPLGQLRQLRDQSCQFRAFLRFSRAPFLSEYDGRPIAGDVRFDAGKDLGFAEMAIEGDGCPRNVPDWTPPFVF